MRQIDIGKLSPRAYVMAQWRLLQTHANALSAMMLSFLLFACSRSAAFADQPRQALRAAAENASPSMTSGWPNLSLPTGIPLVHAIAVSQPPPSADLLIAAITARDEGRLPRPSG